MLAMVAVLGISAVSAVSASATQQTRYFVSGVELTGAAEEVEGTVETAALNSTIAGLAVRIVCTTNKLVAGAGKNAIEKNGLSKGEIEYAGCELYKVEKGVQEAQGAKCTIEIPIFKFTDQLVAGPGGLVEDEFKGTLESETFVEIKITAKSEQTCVLKGMFKAKGTYIASLGSEEERELTEHELVFTSTGSKVKLGAEPASFTNRTRLHLKTNKGWFTNS
jgi:hypothetical protein